MNIKYLAVTTLALGAAVFAGNSNAADAEANSSATVITPIVITKTADLVFGSFAPNPDVLATGTVTVSTSGARGATGAVPSAIGDASTAAQFAVAGQADATYDISIAPTALVSGGNTMALTTFSNFTGANETTGDVMTAGGTLSDLGAQTIYVGGTLTVGAAQVAGNYTGTIAVEVEYN